MWQNCCVSFTGSYLAITWIVVPPCATTYTWPNQMPGYMFSLVHESYPFLDLSPSLILVEQAWWRKLSACQARVWLSATSSMFQQLWQTHTQSKVKTFEKCANILVISFKKVILQRQGLLSVIHGGISFNL